MVKKKVDPTPSSDSTHALPPCLSTIFFTIASPTPVPSKAPLGVQTLEHLEYAFRVLCFQADAVVLHEEHPIAIVLRASDMDDRPHERLGELQRIGQQVLHHLA
jgi:hypothetical protein